MSVLQRCSAVRLLQRSAWHTLRMHTIDWCNAEGSQIRDTHETYLVYEGVAPLQCMDSPLQARSARSETKQSADGVEAARSSVSASLLAAKPYS